MTQKPVFYLPAALALVLTLFATSPRHSQPLAASALLNVAQQLTGKTQRGCKGKSSRACWNPAGSRSYIQPCAQGGTVKDLRGLLWCFFFLRYFFFIYLFFIPSPFSGKQLWTFGLHVHPFAKHVVAFHGVTHRNGLCHPDSEGVLSDLSGGVL